MATWSIGDIHGCWQTLQRLLERIAWDPAEDRLWLVGDLVNRGPQPLQVLRWAAGHRDRLTVVLGNHDLHLLGRAAGSARRKRTEQLDQVLDAPDRDELIDWLRGCPLLHREDRFVLVHAGLSPGWSIDQAEAVAAELSSRLSGPDSAETLAAIAAGKARAWSDALAGADRLRTAAAVFTHLRTVREDGRMCLDFTGWPEAAPDGCRPWYDLSPVPGGEHTVIFGHWASLGAWQRRGLICLDSGCVYGGQLTAVRLEDLRLVQQPSCETAS